jgi:hypothetical protein
MQIEANRKYIHDKMKDDSAPMSYYRAFKDIHAVMPRDCVMVGSGWVCPVPHVSSTPPLAPSLTRAPHTRRWCSEGVRQGAGRVSKCHPCSVGVQVCEGANTMDIGRTILQNFFPRRRLDAGTYGTMGVGA